MSRSRKNMVTSPSTWRRMADKAQREQLRAYRLNGDPRYWVVSSASDPASAYEVTILADHLLCSCRASEFLPYCKHRATVLRELDALDGMTPPLAA
jgi:hypothetical protein